MLVALCTIIVQIVTGQITLQPSIPASGILQKSQLWNLLVLSQNTETVSCRIELVLRERLSGQEMLTATTTSFAVSKGGKQLSIGNLTPIQYSGLSRTAAKASDAFLPAGSYIACYDLVADDEKAGRLASECVSFDVDPLSPPMLSFPTDSTLISTQPSQFSWIAPTPAQMFEDLNYNVLFAEILPGQKPTEAIQENLPFYTEHAVRGNVLSYAGSYRSFEKDKWYAWQVVALDHNGYAAKSEVWIFKIKEESATERVIKATPFVKMKTTNPDMAIAPNGILKLSYHNSLTDTMLQLSVKDMRDTSAANGEKINIQLSQGENLIQYDLRKKMPVKEEGVYKACFENSAGERWELLFRIKFIKE